MDEQALMDIELTQQILTSRIDEALEQFRGREMVAASEVVDLLLDLRLMLFASATPTPAAN